MNTFERFRSKSLISATGVITFLTLIGVPQFAHARANEKLRLSGGSTVALSLESAITSDMPINTVVNFRVVRDVIAGEQVVIKSGSRATGTISKVETNGAIGSPGKVMVTLRSVNAVDGQEIFLRGSVDGEGDNKVGLSVVLGLLCLPLLLIKGGDATVPAGTEVRAYTEQDYMIEPSVPATN
ncbi:MAG: hypothetical protein HY961_21010 [Ignavibacteriae bacterium]|nr:hypothetical protein [Ignavibacteriota bacterium]